MIEYPKQNRGKGELKTYRKRAGSCRNRSWVLIAGKRVGRRKLDGVQKNKMLGLLAARKDRRKVRQMFTSLHSDHITTRKCTGRTTGKDDSAGLQLGEGGMPDCNSPDWSPIGGKATAGVILAAAARSSWRRIVAVPVGLPPAGRRSNCRRGLGSGCKELESPEVLWDIRGRQEKREGGDGARASLSGGISCEEEEGGERERWAVNEPNGHERSLVHGSFENSYIPENPRTPPISYISKTAISFKKTDFGTPPKRIFGGKCRLRIDLEMTCDIIIEIMAVNEPNVRRTVCEPFSGKFVYLINERTQTRFPVRLVKRTNMNNALVHLFKFVKVRICSFTFVRLRSFIYATLITKTQGPSKKLESNTNSLNLHLFHQIFQTSWHRRLNTPPHLDFTPQLLNNHTVVEGMDGGLVFLLAHLAPSRIDLDALSF
ncbi:hypothetical protein LXL04_020474 [Taraxacum kok-saghyz]